MSPVESVAGSFPRFLARGERRRAAELDELRIRTREFAQKHVVPVADGHGQSVGQYAIHVIP